jgi:hypothetical protein
MKRVTAFGTALTIAGLMTVTQLGSAEAAQHQNANIYVNWSFPTAGSGGFGQNVDQEVLVIRKAKSSYWAQLWKWTDDPAHGGYIGLQTNGNRSNGSTGDTADFSLWNSIAAVGPKSKSCARNAEANGYNCAAAYTLKSNTWYRLRVWKGQRDPDGQWWQGWVKNMSTGTDTWIGSIKVAGAHQAITSVQNFSEYFGKQVACDKVPMSIVDFSQPAADLTGNGAYRYYSRYAYHTMGICTGGGVSVVSEFGTKAARTTLGGSIVSR